MSILIFILILAILVLIHEFGHFIAAKKSGVLVEEFGFGFPPRLFGYKHKGTIYSINAIPLGGFVKVYGEEYKEKINPKLKSKSFSYKKPHLKAIIIVAGVVMNVLLGAAIYYFLLSNNNFRSEPFPLLKPYHFRFGNQEGRIAVVNIVPGSPAQYAGVNVEDLVLRFKNSTYTAGDWIQINSGNQLIENIKSQAGKTVQIELLNIKNGKNRIVSVVPQLNKQLGRAVIGVNLADVAIIKYETPSQKLLSGFEHSYNVLSYNFNTIGYLFASSVKEKTLAPISGTVSGPVGIFGMINDIIKSSGEKLVVNLLNTVALLSLSLAMINILPFPALDGGRLAFVLYEWITKKRVNETFEKYLNLAGILLLLSLAILITINDILKIHLK